MKEFVVAPTQPSSRWRRVFSWASARRALKGFAILALIGFVGVVALLASLWWEHRTETTLPDLTGTFTVGRATYVWTDDAHPDELAPVSGTKRELVVWIWYPADAGQSAAPPEDYLPADWRAAFERRGGALINLLTRDRSLVHGHSLRSPALSRQKSSYPIVIMRGGASAEVLNYSTLAEDLASHGYIVVGFDAPYRTGIVVFADGRVITRTPANNPELYSGQELERVGGKLLAAWSADSSFVLDQLDKLNTSDPSGKFTGRLDMNRVGIFGHSLGGATALQFCHDDPRCKAGIDLDGIPFGSAVKDGIQKPFMFVLTEHGNMSDPESRDVLAKIQSIYERLPPEGRFRIKIHGANHFLFSDDGALLKSHIILGALRLFGIVGIEGRRQLAVTSHCVHTFFDAYLKGTSTTAPDILSSTYPEIEGLK